MSKVTIEREKCIGCGTCASVCSKYFKIEEDGKSSLIGGKRDAAKNIDELELTSLECAKEASESCPVQCIHVQE